MKGTWTIVVHMHGALPGTYHIDLRDTNCTSFKIQLSEFKVKSDGSGDTSATYFAGNRQSFYLRVHDNNQAISYYAPLLKIGGNP